MRPDADLTLRGHARLLREFLFHRDYLAPELAQGAAGDERSDLYGLAWVAFAVLTGPPPFTAVTIPAILVAHAVRPRPAASEHRCHSWTRRIPRLNA